MPRKPRIHVAGAFYHVMARGNRKQPVFHDEEDYHIYLRLLRKYSQRYDTEIHGYVLMPNHVHFLLRVGEVPLPKFMQGVQQSYTQIYNKRYEQVGHLFQGRYKCLYVNKEAYLLELIRYIHLNPVKAGLVADPRDYRWSSQGEYYADKGERWVQTGFIKSLLAQYGGTVIDDYQLVPESIALLEESELAGADGQQSKQQGGQQGKQQGGQRGERQGGQLAGEQPSGHQIRQPSGQQIRQPGGHQAGGQNGEQQRGQLVERQQQGGRLNERHLGGQQGGWQQQGGQQDKHQGEQLGEQQGWWQQGAPPSQPEPRPTMEAVLAATTASAGVAPEIMLGPSRARQAVEARYLLVYAACRLCRYSLQDVAAFLNRSVSAVSKCLHRAEEKWGIAGDDTLHRLEQQLKQQLYPLNAKDKAAQ